MASKLSFLLRICLLSTLPILTAAASGNLTGPYVVHNVTRYQNIKYENLSIRSNGEILVTIFDPPASLYLIDPLGIRPPTLIYTFDDVEHVAGIYELSKDIFYIAGGNWTISDPARRVPDSLQVFKVNMTDFFAWPNGTIARDAVVSKAASVPQGGLLNGVTSIPGQINNFVFIADSFAGVIWRVEVTGNNNTGGVVAVLNDTTTANPPAAMAIGVNGVKVYNDTLYYTNTALQALYKVPISKQGYVTGTPSQITDNIGCDDLELDFAGNIYVAGPNTVVVKVTPDGDQEIVAGTYNSTSSTLITPTALQFGKLDSDWMSLYVTTNGGVFEVVNGTQGVSRIDVFDFPPTAPPFNVPSSHQT